MKGYRSQSGVSLLELLVSIAIIGVIMAALSTGIYQIVKVTSRGRDRLTALHDLENAIHWIGRDGQMADATDLGDGEPPVSTMTLTWIERCGTEEIAHSITYSVSGTELMRDYDGDTMRVARHVQSIQFSRSGSLLTVTTESAPGEFDVSEQRTFMVRLRPSG